MKALKIKLELKLIRNYNCRLNEKKLLILGSGFSRERNKLKNCKAVFKEIKNIYTTKISEPDGNLVATLRKFKPDFVFNALHA